MNHDGASSSSAGQILTDSSSWGGLTLDQHHPLSALCLMPSCLPPGRFLTSWLLAALTVLVIPPLSLLFWVYGRLSRR